MSCKISTIDKKSIVVTEYFTKHVGEEEYQFNVETVWRWGYVIVEEDADDIDADGIELNLDRYSIIDQEYNDGTSCFWHFSDNVPEEVRDEIELFCEERDYSEVEELGWTFSDTQTTFVGDLEIEQLDNDDDGGGCEEERDPNNPTWPFS